jgi:ABC-type transporter Mla subunit MlaD
MATNEISLSILTEINQSVKSLERLQSEASKSFKKISEESQKSAKAREDGIKKSNDQIAKSFNLIKGAAVAAFAFIAGRAVLGAFNDVIQAASEEQQAIQRLNTSLQLTGKFTEEASKGFVEFADSIEKTTTQTGEAVLNAGALIQSLTRLDTEALKAVTEGAVNLSAVFGKDLAATSRILGKAINGNTAGLKQFGIEVDSGGTKAQRLEKILAALAKSQGAAAAQSNTFAGASTQLNNAFDDISKSLGRVIVDNPAVVASIKVVTEFVRIFSKAIDDNADALKSFIGDGLDALIKVIPQLITPIQFTITAISVLQEAFFRTIKAAAALANIFTTGPILAINAFRASILLFKSDVLSAAATFSQFLDTLGLTDGINTKALQIALAEVNDELSKIALTVEETESGKFFNGIANGAEKAIGVSNRLAGTLVGTFESSRAGIEITVDRFDDLKKGATNAGKSIKAVGDIADDSGDELNQLGDDGVKSAKDLTKNYDKFKSTFESLGSEAEKQGKSRSELIDIELKSSFDLADATEKELKAQGKLTDEIKNQIKEFRGLATAKADSSKQSLTEEKQKKTQDEFDKADAEKEAEDAAAIAVAQAALNEAFQAGADLLKQGISQAFALASSILNGQIFTELNNALKSTILAPIEALENLRELTGTFDALKGENSLSRTFDSLITELPKFVDTFVSKFPALVQIFIKSFPLFVEEVVKAIPVIIDQLVSALPEIVSTIADGFDSVFASLLQSLPDIVGSIVDTLPRIAASILDGITALVGKLPEIFDRLLRGLPAVFTAILSRLPDLILAITKAIPEIVRVFADNIDEIIIAIVEQLPAIAEALIYSMIVLIPQVAIALVDSLITKGGIFRIAVALVKALVIELPVALANGIAQALKDLSGSIGGSIANGFKTIVENIKIPVPKFPKIEAPKLEFKIPDNIRDLFNGKAFVTRVSEAFNKFIDQLKKAVTPGGGSGGFLGQAGKKAGDFVSKASPFSKGGTVYAADGLFVAQGTDRVPAMLTPGETVVSTRDTERLTAFLDQVSSVSAGSPDQNDQNSAEVVRLLKTLIAQSAPERGSKDLTVNIQVGEKQLSEVILNLNRQGFRVA